MMLAADRPWDKHPACQLRATSWKLIPRLIQTHADSTLIVLPARQDREQWQRLACVAIDGLREWDRDRLASTNQAIE